MKTRTFPSVFRHPLAGFTLAALGLCVAGSTAVAADDPPVNDDLRDRICLTVFNAVRGVAGEDNVPDLESMELYRQRGLEATGDADGTTYAYRLQPEDPSGERIVIDAQVAMLRKGHVPVMTEEWERSRVSEEDPRLGTTFFRERTTNQVRWAATYFVLVRDGVQLRMRVVRKRPDDRTRDDLVRLAAPQWEVFVGEAERNRLFDRARVFVRLAADAPADLGSRSPTDGDLESGAILHLIRDHREAAVIPLEVRAEARDIKDDEPYIINTNIRDDYSRPGITLTDARGAPLGDSDDDGRKDVTVPDGTSSAIVHMRFEPFELTGSSGPQDRMLSQLGYVRFYYRGPDDENERAGANDRDDAYSDVRGSRAGGWWPIVTRFEIAGFDFATHHLYSRSNWREFEDRFIKEAESKKWLDLNRLTYNGRSAIAGSKEIAWKRVLDWAATHEDDFGRPRGFEETEVVPMGWRLLPDDLTFATTANAPEAEPTQGIPVNAGVMVITDLEIVFPPLPREEDIPAPDFDDGFGATSAAASIPLDAVQAEADFRKQLILDKFTLTKRRVGSGNGIQLPADMESSEFAAAAQQLAMRLRQPVSVDSEHPEETVREMTFDTSSLDDNFPIEERNAPIQNRPRWGYLPAPVLAREGGIFELRLQMEISRAGDARDSKKIDVAIRYNVYAGYDVRQIHSETERR